MRSHWIYGLAALLASVGLLGGQTKTVGLLSSDTAKVSPGYILMPPMHSGRTYLIDNEGQIVNSWHADNSEPGRMAYLLANGHLLRSVSTPGTGPAAGGANGGRIVEYDWKGNLVWQFDYSTPQYAMHHDIKVLPNGNVLAVVMEAKTLAEMTAAGFRPNIIQGNGSVLLPDSVIEIQPTGPSSGTIVWEWHVWDHLVQDYDATKSNSGVPSQHPELVNPNASTKQIAADWNHVNAIDYNAELDQIMISVHGNSEIWIIDHSTTTAEAAGHTGGKRGKGGDLLYRWGNPQMYGAGTASSQMLYAQHDSQWIPAGKPGAGNILVFNNGVNRPGGNYSSVLEIVPPLDGSGGYTIAAGSAFGPASPIWSYTGAGDERFYEVAISGADRQANGNTVICWGTHGVIEEVTSSGEIVWKYVNPVIQSGPLLQGQTPGVDQQGQSLANVFKVRKYPPDYAGLSSQDLTQKGTVEVYGTRYVNGASLLNGSTSAGAILTIFGDSGLADSAVAASTVALPGKLGGTSVTLTDSASVTQTCALYYVSPTQINLVVPDGVAAGKATIAVQRDSGKSLSGAVTVDAVAPGLFTIGASGVGAILGLRVDGAGQRSDVPVFTYNATQNAFATAPIDLGAAADQVYLSVYGTGIRAASSVTAAIGGKAVPVLGAAAQSQYPGLDQVNLGPLPRTLAGSGSVSLSLKVNNINSNSVTLSIK